MESDLIINRFELIQSKPQYFSTFLDESLNAKKKDQYLHNILEF